MSKDVEVIKKIKKAVARLDVNGLSTILRQAFSSGLSGIDIVTEGIMKGIKHSGDIGLIVAAEVLSKEISGLIDVEKNKIKNDSKKYSGKVVIGTVKGDIHDLGKNIVISLMEAMGIELIDLGVDVPPEKFIENCRSPGVKVIALSNLLSVTASNVKLTIQDLEKEGLRDKVKVIIGGAGTSRELAEDVKADAYAKDAGEGIKIIEKWLNPNHK